MPSRLNKMDVFTIKSRYDPFTGTYDDSNNWNFINACAVCTNRPKCRYNSVEIISNGTCLNFNYSNSTVITKVFYDTRDVYSIDRANKFKQGKSPYVTFNSGDVT